MRRALIAKIKIAQKELGLDDATYRALLERVTGKRSCTECSLTELECVVEDLRQHGFVPKKTAGRRPSCRESASNMMRKIEALLLENGWTWNYAHGTAKKMFNVDRVEWLFDSNMHKLVAALQISANRKKKEKTK